MVNDRPLRWWAGIATVLPPNSIIPPTGRRWTDRLNELRCALGRPPVFPWPEIPRQVARSLAKPTSTGFGDLLCAWMMPMTVAGLLGWRLRIPVPLDAGGIRHSPGRPSLRAAWLQDRLNLPSGVELVSKDDAPFDCDWFCTIEQQWHLNSCMETSFDTIPSWIRSLGIERAKYYSLYRYIASTLLSPGGARERRDAHVLAVHARRDDRGDPKDEPRLDSALKLLAQRYRNWVVVSDDEQTRERITSSLERLGCALVTAAAARAGDPAERLFADFQALTTAAGVVCSVKGGWSAFPYAATRISGAPLLISSELKEARVWRVMSVHSKVPIQGIFFGAAGVSAFLAALAATTADAPSR